MRAIKKVEQASGEEPVSINIDEILSQIKKINKNSKLQILEPSIGKNLNIFDSGNETMNYILGCRGLARGKIIQIVGGTSSGKTTLSQLFIASIQKAGKIVAWEDAEHAFEPEYAQRFGIDLTRLLVEEPASAEEVFSNIFAMLAVPDIGAIVVDSVASLTPEAELDDSKQKALLASFLSVNLKKLTSRMTKDSPVIILLNQERDKFDAMSFGEKSKGAGGRAVDFYSHIILKTSRIGKVKNKEETKVIGVKTKVEAKKNKLGMPFREGVLLVDYRRGISRFSGFIELLEELKIISKSGRDYSYKGTVFKREEIQSIFETNREAIIQSMEEE